MQQCARGMCSRELQFFSRDQYTMQEKKNVRKASHSVARLKQEYILLAKVTDIPYSSSSFLVCAALQSCLGMRLHYSYMHSRAIQIVTMQAA